MHRVILAAPNGVEVDHRSGDGLDNRRANLRLATHAQNHQNRTRKILGCTSRHKGVHMHCGRWQARIADGPVVDGHAKRRSLGHFDSEDAAGRAYDAAALVSFGEFASLNFPITA
jgi:hypothetical protein